MAKYIQVASVLFPLEHVRGQNGARQSILEDTAATLDGLRGLGLDLVVLSEGIESLAQTPEQAEALPAPGPLLRLYMDFAAAEKCHVAGSVKLQDSDGVHNSIAYIGPDGKPLGAYHKTYLTAGELEDGLVPGRGPVCIDTAIGRLGGAICFDLNFEELRLQYTRLRPDILTFASLFHGGLAQSMWAYTCRAFFISAVQFHGGGILDPFGRPLALTDCYTAVARTRINLDRVMVHLDYNRTKFLEIERKYGAEVCIDVPPNIGSAILYSASEARTAMDIAREFGLILLDDYFHASAGTNAQQRPRAHRAQAHGKACAAEE